MVRIDIEDLPIGGFRLFQPTRLVLGKRLFE